MTTSTRTPTGTAKRTPAAPPTAKEQFQRLLAPIARALRSLPTSANAVQRAVPFRGGLVGRVRAAALAAIGGDWLLTKEAGGIRFGRVVKDLHGFSVDAVLMDRPGPRHKHPNGEYDLCFATAGSPRFDGHPEGWVTYGKGSVHVPTVSDGRMLILYFLPGGAIEFMNS